jgi:Na+/H+-dicarboxylate symporter
MLKTTLRFLVVTLIAVALGFLIYHLNQPSGTSSFGSFSREIGGEDGLREGGSLFGLVGNLLLVAVVTAIVVPLQKAFATHRAPARAR